MTRLFGIFIVENCNKAVAAMCVDFMLFE